MSEEIKDKLIGFNNVKRGKNRKGHDRFQFYLSPEAAVELAEIMMEKAEGTELGVKMDIHFNVRTNTHTGHEFESAFMFVKEKQPMGQVFSQKAVKKVDKDEIKNRIKKFKEKSVD